MIPQKPVTIVGASPRNPWAFWAARNLKVGGHAGPLYLVNTNLAGTELWDEAVYETVNELPDGEIGDVFIAVPSSSCLDVAKAACARGASSIIIAASGFSESGAAGRTAQREIIRVCREAGIPLLGPNSVGFADLRARRILVGQPIELSGRAGSISVVAQSGGMLASLLHGLIADDLEIDVAMALGNAAGITVARAIADLGARPTTKVIVAYVESFGENSLGIETTLRSLADDGKHLVIVKTGATAQSQDIALSHTGGASGEDEFLTLVLRQHKAYRCTDIELATRLVGLLHLQAGANRAGIEEHTQGIAVVSSSGGAAGLVADMAQGAGLKLSEMTRRTVRGLSSVEIPGAYLHNPFDLTAELNGVASRQVAFTLILRDENVGMALMPNTVSLPDDSPDRSHHRTSLTRHAEWAEAAGGAPVVMATVAGQDLTPFARTLNGNFSRFHIVRGLESTVRALALMYPAGQRVKAEPEIDDQPTPVSAAILSPGDALGLATAAGLPLVEGVLVGVDELEDIRHLDFPPPYAVKVEAEGILHKADIGGVRLDCLSRTEAYEAATDMVAHTRNTIRESIVGVAVQRMVRGPEILVGLQRSKVFGAFVTIGLGGALGGRTPLTRTLRLPFDADSFSEALVSSYVSDLFQSDQTREEFYALVQRLGQNFLSGALSNCDLAEFNPVILTASGPVIVDMVFMGAS